MYFLGHLPSVGSDNNIVVETTCEGKSFKQGHNSIKTFYFTRVGKARPYISFQWCLCPCWRFSFTYSPRDNVVCGQEVRTNLPIWTTEQKFLAGVLTLPRITQVKKFALSYSKLLLQHSTVNDFVVSIKNPFAVQSRTWHFTGLQVVLPGCLQLQCSHWIALTNNARRRPPTPTAFCSLTGINRPTGSPDWPAGASARWSECRAKTGSALFSSGLW